MLGRVKWIVTATEVYELTTQGGAGDFQGLIQLCSVLGECCLIGGLAVNCYVEPVYTLDADLVFVSSGLAALKQDLRVQGFKVEENAYSVNALASRSQLRIQFTTDLRYQAFLPRAIEAEVLGVRVRVACLEDVTQGRLWAYSDETRLFSKRKKDELDLIRLAEAYPHLKAGYPRALIDQIERG